MDVLSHMLSTLWEKIKIGVSSIKNVVSNSKPDVGQACGLVQQQLSFNCYLITMRDVVICL